MNSDNDVSTKNISANLRIYPFLQNSIFDLRKDLDAKSNAALAIWKNMNVLVTGETNVKASLYGEVEMYVLCALIRDLRPMPFGEVAARVSDTGGGHNAEIVWSALRRLMVLGTVHESRIRRKVLYALVPLNVTPIV